jgi:hypothetical protein
MKCGQQVQLAARNLVLIWYSEMIARKKQDVFVKVDMLELPLPIERVYRRVAVKNKTSIV